MIKTMGKNLIIIILGAISAPILSLIKTYIYDDWDFFKFFFPLIIMDTVLGVAKNWKYGTLSSKAWGKIFWKLFSYGFILILAHIMTHFTIDGQVVIVFSWFDDAVYSALMIKEGISILENLGAINENLVPTWLLNKLKYFDVNGKFDTNETNTKQDSL